MNRKQLRRAICGSAVILTLGGSLLSQASGEGGFISRLWDNRPKLSESRLNPRNWFGNESNDSVADADLKPVVAVRPELTQNPFGAESSFVDSGNAQQEAAPSGRAAGAASQETKQASAAPASSKTQVSVNAGDGAGVLPVIAPATTQRSSPARTDQPARSLDSVFRRPSREMVEQARRRKLGKTTVAEDGTNTAADAESLSVGNKPAPSYVVSEDGTATGKQPSRNTLMRMLVKSQQEPSTDVADNGRVALGSLDDGHGQVGSSRGYVRLEDSYSVQSPHNQNDEPATSEGDAAFHRLMAQIKSTAGKAGSTTAGAATAPRLPDGLTATPPVDSGPVEIADRQVPETRLIGDGTSASESDTPGVKPVDGQPPAAESQSIDDMIARTRAEMNGTFLARQAEQERDLVTGDGASENRVNQVSVSQLEGAGSAVPLMVPQGFSPESFRTYGETRGADGRSPSFPAAIRSDEAKPDDGLARQAAPQAGLSRIQQAAQSARQRTGGPAIVPGQAGSGIVIDGKQYSVVKPKVTSNAAPSLSVPDNSAFRRLSYERRADDLAGQVERLADSGVAQPFLITPGEPLPQAESAAKSSNVPSATEKTAAVSGSPIDWPDDEDLAPVKSKSGGTSWGLIIFCLALLTAGTHIGVSRLRQSRMAAAAGKS